MKFEGFLEKLEIWSTSMLILEHLEASYGKKSSGQNCSPESGLSFGGPPMQKKCILSILRAQT